MLRNQDRTFLSVPKLWPRPSYCYFGPFGENLHFDCIFRRWNSGLFSYSNRLHDEICNQGNWQIWWEIILIFSCKGSARNKG